MEKVTRLRKKQGVRHNSDACVVLRMQHKTPPNLSAFVQMSIHQHRRQSHRNLRFTPNDSVETINMEREPYEVQLHRCEQLPLPPRQTCEDVTVPMEVAEGGQDCIIEGEQYTPALHRPGNFTSIDIPPTITMTVKESPEGVKGDSVNVFKPATMETGLIVQVTLFIKEGRRIVVNRRRLLPKPGIGAAF
ncbi:MAG: elongation factor P [Verrucomicrobiales bacterium]